MKISARCILMVTLVILLTAGAGLAQQITGSITGTVTDPTGAAVSGAALKLTNMGTGAVQSATTNSSGDFRFLLLPPGNYPLDPRITGFKSFRHHRHIFEADRSLTPPHP